MTELAPTNDVEDSPTRQLTPEEKAAADQRKIIEAAIGAIPLRVAMGERIDRGVKKNGINLNDVGM